MFPVPFFAIPNILLAFWTTAKLCIDVFVAAFIRAPWCCSGGVGASQDPLCLTGHLATAKLICCFLAQSLSFVASSLILPSCSHYCLQLLFLLLHTTFLNMLVEGLCYWTPITTKSDHLFLTFASSLLCDHCPREKLPLCPCSLTFLRASGKRCQMSLIPFKCVDRSPHPIERDLWGITSLCKSCLLLPLSCWFSSKYFFDTVNSGFRYVTGQMNVLFWFLHLVITSGFQRMLFNL